MQRIIHMLDYPVTVYVCEYCCACVCGAKDERLEGIYSYTCPVADYLVDKP